jgi:hypothetical protein
MRPTTFGRIREITDFSDARARVPRPRTHALSGCERPLVKEPLARPVLSREGPVAIPASRTGWPLYGRRVPAVS